MSKYPPPNLNKDLPPLPKPDLRENPKACDFCGKVYYTRENLERHVKQCTSIAFMYKPPTENKESSSGGGSSSQAGGQGTGAN